MTGMRRSGAAVLVTLAMLAAGCADQGQPAIITAEDNTILPAPTPTAPPKAEKGNGHIAGFVVDEAYRIMEGVRVVLPAYALNDTTDRKGEFSFVDLPPGSYLMEVNVTGYLPIRTMLDVKADRFTRVQVVLTAIPPPEPWHQTWDFEGYGLLPNPVYPIGSTYQVDTPDPGLHTLIVEAFMHAEGTFQYDIGSDDCCHTYAEGSGGAPLRVELRVNGTKAVDDGYRVWIAPSSLVPQFEVPYELFVTAFYNGPPPEDWSIATA